MIKHNDENRIDENALEVEYKWMIKRAESSSDKLKIIHPKLLLYQELDFAFNATSSSPF